jgi:hypothetical protein
MKKFVIIVLIGFFSVLGLLSIGGIVIYLNRYNIMDNLVSNIRQSSGYRPYDQQRDLENRAVEKLTDQQITVRIIMSSCNEDAEYLIAVDNEKSSEETFNYIIISEEKKQFDISFGTEKKVLINKNFGTDEDPEFEEAIEEITFCDHVSELITVVADLVPYNQIQYSTNSEGEEVPEFKIDYQILQNYLKHSNIDYTRSIFHLL